MTAGEYTPAAVKAAPKRAPDAIDRRVLASMLAIALFNGLKPDQIEDALTLSCLVLRCWSLIDYPTPSVQ
jgi:hypothetical protein